MYIPLSFLAAVVGFAAADSSDRYSEHIVRSPLPVGELVRFQFSFSTNSSDSHLLGVFPQPFASVLGPHKQVISSVEGHIARGRWKESKWGVPLMKVFPPGASMAVTFKNDARVDASERSLVWTQTAWLFASAMGGSFESLLPDNDSFYWMTPMDLPFNVRAATNPNEHSCTENLERITDLLPCRSRRGLGKAIVALSLELAKSEFVSISLKGEVLDTGGFALSGEISAVLPNSVPTQSLDDPASTCPAISERSVLPIHTTFDSTQSEREVRVQRSIVNKAGKSEKTFGKLVVSFTNNGVGPRKITYYEQLPFFLTPLFHTQSATTLDLTRTSVVHSDGVRTPTYLVYEVVVPSGSSAAFSIDLAKKFIPTDKFSFSFEKGFDLGSAVVMVGGGNEWIWTRGLVVVIPLVDATGTFNIIAIASTAIAILFGMIFRHFTTKRSELFLAASGQAPGRQPPLVKLITWVVGKVRGFVAGRTEKKE